MTAEPSPEPVPEREALDSAERVAARALREGRTLTRGARYGTWRVALDLAIWVAMVAAAEWLDHLAATALLAFLIGAVPLHDLLVQGHEAMHGNASRNRTVNDLVLWFAHALVGISGRAHRAFHFDHHRFVGTPRDPELRIHGAIGGRTTWTGLLRIVLFAHPFVNGHPWRDPVTRVTGGQVAVDLALSVALHGVLLSTLGARIWLLYGVMPAVTGLPLVAALRAVAEHLSPRPTDLVKTRLYRARRLGQLAWSNVDHHVEHHLCPAVPFHNLPELRRRLTPLYADGGIELDAGLFRTAMAVTSWALRSDD